jgi:L-asparaginase II
MPTELVRVYRSGFHEGSHFGSVVVTDVDGSVLHERGDVTAPIFPRSSSKPFQAVAMLGSGADLVGADLALASASHSGEPMHVERALAMLARAEVTEDDLGCPTALPMNDAARIAVLQADGGARRIYMNCSGKHAGMLTACVAHDWAIDDYLAPGHPLQQRVADEVTRLTGEAPAAVGIDGCGAPLFAISLLALARGFGAVNAAADGTFERQVANAMRAHPEMVGGTGREDTRLMQALPGLLVKGGAEGVHCAALPDGRCVAVKITDGGDRARMPVLVGALRSLGVGMDDPGGSALLDELGTGIVLGGGVPVGTVTVAPDVF